ncbi:MAG: nuclear transport factor 2 family protein [Verrucomicrobiota bacterium]|nr:nuclear transport factor 2 family protein [Verrucomicrobiota bacterium]
MKKVITYAMTVLFATVAVSIAAPDNDAIIAKEKAAWQAFKDKKADDFKKLISADLIAVYADGIMNMQKELDAMSKTDMKSFSLSDINVVMTDANTAILSYTAKVESSIGGKDNSGNYNCGSVWQMKKGEWQGIFHTDMKEEASAKPASQ